MVSESWLRSLFKTPRKGETISQKVLVGVLAFEVASSMSMLIHLWKFLGNKQIIKLREEISNSAGLKKLVSADNKYIVRLICAELVENMMHVAKSVARLGRKCSETLSDIERTVRRMKGNKDLYGADLVEIRKKVAQKRADIKNLCEFSLWNRTYNDTVFVLA